MPPPLTTRPPLITVSADAALLIESSSAFRISAACGLLKEPRARSTDGTQANSEPTAVQAPADEEAACILAARTEEGSSMPWIQVIREKDAEGELKEVYAHSARLSRPSAHRR
jgi:hypothetical protein